MSVRDGSGETTARSKYAVLVTGANSGVGLAICRRLIDEFLLRNHPHLRPSRFILIVTTRSQRKGNDTVEQLRQHVKALCDIEELKFPGITEQWLSRIEFRHEIVDLTSIVSVQTLAKKLLHEQSAGNSLEKLDAIILNAGIGGWTGVNYPKAIWAMLRDWIDALTYPKFKIAGIGWVTKPQIGPSETTGKYSEESTVKAAINGDVQPPVGEVFCANVFGHYLLGHYLNPLLSTPMHESSGRIIWMSTMEAYRSSLHLTDIQGIKNPTAYESSKRLTDVLALGSEFHSVSPWIETYFAQPTIARAQSRAASRTTQSSPIRPKHYLAHPGICSTTIMPYAWWLRWAAVLSFHIARWLGSPWHPIDVYLGATAPVWLAMVSGATLESFEASNGKSKWGSGTVPNGTECVRRTWVEGWGWGGKPEEVPIPGKSRKNRDVTAQDREDFEEESRECWKQLEELRKEWEDRVAKAGI